MTILPDPGPSPQAHSDPFRALGLHGLTSIATPVLAGLVTGDPVLLVGPHGTAKTALVQALAEALDLRFKSYDASKAMFEDIVGFPDPAGLAEGNVRYVPTAVSIWGTELVLVDELSRASPGMQNKWLEVIRGRQVMGVPVPSLRHVFAAMNPPGYTGARPLDPALVGRFGFILHMPGVDSMTPDEVDGVIRTVGRVDAPGCSAWPRSQADGAPIRELVEAARERLPLLLEKLEAALVTYVRELASRLRGEGIALDGRRLALCFRGLAAALAVEEARGRPVPRDAQVHDIVLHLLPGAALDQPEAPATVFSAHVHAWGVAFGDAAEDPVRFGREQRVIAVLGQSDPLAAVEAYTSCLDVLTEEEHHEIASRVLRHLRSSTPVLGRGQAEVPPGRSLAALRRLLRVVTANAEQVPLDVVGRVMVGWQAIAGMRTGRFEDLNALIAEGGGVSEAPYSDDDWLACRVAIELTRDEPGDPDEHPSFDRAANLRAPLRNALRTLD